MFPFAAALGALAASLILWGLLDARPGAAALSCPLLLAIIVLSYVEVVAL